MHSSRQRSRMCRRPSCQGPASATLSFSYETAEVLLLDLLEEQHPSRWDLCRTHADTLGVPRGWSLIDDRGPAGAAGAGSSIDGADRPGGDRNVRGAARADAGTADPPEAADAGRERSRPNRYAALSAQLPRLAGQHRPGSGADPADRHRSADDAPPGDRGDGGQPDGGAGPRRSAHPPGVAAAASVAEPDTPGVVAHEPIPGQLTMSLPDAPGDVDAVWGYAGNVVPLWRSDAMLGPVR